MPSSVDVYLPRSILCRFIHFDIAAPDRTEGNLPTIGLSGDV